MTQGAQAVFMGQKSENLLKNYLKEKGFISVDNKEIDLLNSNVKLKDGKYFIFQKTLNIPKDEKKVKEVLLKLGIEDEDYFDAVSKIEYKPDFILFKVTDNEIKNMSCIEVKSKTSAGSDHEKYIYIGYKFNLFKKAGYPFDNLFVVLTKMLDLKAGSYIENKKLCLNEVKTVAGIPEVYKCIMSLNKGLEVVKENNKIMFLSEIVSGEKEFWS